MKLRYWDAVIAADADEKPIATFDVELSDDVAIKLMRLWRVGDRLEVRCGPEHQVEMSPALKEQIQQMAIDEFKRRN